MHKFSIQDKTVTFQYENGTLHVSISQRSLINTPVLRSENTLYKSSEVVFDGHILKNICKLFTCDTLLLATTTTETNLTKQTLWI